MEIEDYNLPLHLNCLAPGTLQDLDGVKKAVIRYDAFIEWENIMTIEEFVKYESFPDDERNKDKTIIVTKAGQNFVIQENVNQIAHIWGMYKVWKAKKRNIILNTFSKN